MCSNVFMPSRWCTLNWKTEIKRERKPSPFSLCHLSWGALWLNDKSSVKRLTAPRNQSSGLLGTDTCTYTHHSEGTERANDSTAESSFSLSHCLVSDPSILALFSVFCSPHKDTEESERLKTREMPVGSICSVVCYTQAMGRPPLTPSNCQTHTHSDCRGRGSLLPWRPVQVNIPFPSFPA